MRSGIAYMHASGFKWSILFLQRPGVTSMQLGQPPNRMLAKLYKGPQRTATSLPLGSLFFLRGAIKTGLFVSVLFFSEPASN